MITCHKCNNKLSPDTKRNIVCNARVFETFSCSHCKTSTTEVPANKKTIPRKAIIFGKISIAIITVLILVLSLFSCGSGKYVNDYALYLKDSEIFFTNLKKDNKTLQLTSHLLDTDKINDKLLAKSGDLLGICTYMSENGKYIFFPDKISSGDYGFNLYYREVAKPNAEAVKIDSDVRSYTVNASATLITYIKGEEKSLYQYKIGKDSKDKIASEVKRFEVSDNGKKIVFINSENSIYLKYAGKEKEKIAGDVSAFKYVNKNFTTIYYIKDDTMYKQDMGADRVKIAHNVRNVIKIYDSGEIYYLTSETEKTHCYSLCFYNGIEEIEITDAFVDYYSYATDVPVIAYTAYRDSKLSIFGNYENYIAVKNNANFVEQEKEATNFTINSAGTDVYYIDKNIDNKNYGTLYHISITNDIVSKAEAYDSDVYIYYCNFVNTTGIKYFKDYRDNNGGELYINKNKIDHDVKENYVTVCPNVNRIFYITDYNNDKEYYTLKVYDGKKSVKIADNVHSHFTTPDGKVFYLYDYSLSYYKGELYVWSNGKTRKIDDDVVCVSPIIYDKYRGI